MPIYRKVASKENHRVEVYCFAPHDSIISRYVAVGISGCKCPDGSSIDWESLMVAPKDYDGNAHDEVSKYILDIMAHSLAFGLRLEVGQALDESPVAPDSWRARGILIDDPRGEPEFLERINFEKQCIRLLWLVPIHKVEYESIVRSGLDEFDAADQASEWSLADPWRDSFI